MFSPSGRLLDKAKKDRIVQISMLLSRQDPNQLGGQDAERDLDTSLAGRSQNVPGADLPAAAGALGA